MTYALALDREVEEGLDAEVGLVHELGDHHGSSGRTIEVFKDRIVETLQCSDPNTGVPNGLMVAMMTSVSIDVSNVQAMQFESRTYSSQSIPLLNSGVGWSAVLAMANSICSMPAPSNVPNLQKP